MINVVIPLAANLFFDSTEYFYPKPLIEIRGTPIIQLVVDSLKSLPDPKRFIFILNKKDEGKFHLSDTFKLVTDSKAEFVFLEGESKGATCSVLMAIDQIKGADPVIVANGDQVLDVDLAKAIKDFQQKKLEAAVLCIDSVHPRWAYVRLGQDGHVVEAEPKRPISRNAIAGFFYFASGEEFVRLAMKSIEKGAEVQGSYYVASVLNEYVLEGRKVGTQAIENSKCRTFYSIQKIEEAQRELP